VPRRARPRLYDQFRPRYHRLRASFVGVGTIQQYRNTLIPLNAAGRLHP